MAEKKKKRQLDDSDFYFLSDQTIELLDKKAVKRFEWAKAQCGILNIDELNVIKVCKKLYADLAADNKKAFLQLAVYMYRWAWIRSLQKYKKESDAKELEAILRGYELIVKYLYKCGVDQKRNKESDAKELEAILSDYDSVVGYIHKYGVKRKRKKEPDEKWLETVLSAYDPVTKYIYEHEVERKRDYTAEAVIASPTKEYEFRRGLSYWSRMTAHYADTITDQAALKAFKDADIKKVMWVSQRDDRVCGECMDRDGKIYPIDQVPPKPHFGCRCYLQPVLS